MGRMIRTRRTRFAAVVLAVVAAMGACSTDPPQSDPPSASSGPSSPSLTPSPSSTVSLSAEEQQAVDEAAKTVLRYRQVIVDLFSGARTDLNDLNSVATGDLLASDLRNVQQGLVGGAHATQGVISVVAAEPVTVQLQKGRIRLRACVDLTGIAFTEGDGSTVQGTRGRADYVLVQHEDRWLVSRMLQDQGDIAC